MTSILPSLVDRYSSKRDLSRRWVGRVLKFSAGRQEVVAEVYGATPEGMRRRKHAVVAAIKGLEEGEGRRGDRQMVVELTVDAVIGLGPCSDYSRGQVEELFGGRERVTLREALEDGRIPVEDRVWLGLRVDGPHVRPALDRIVGRAVETYALRCGILAVEAWAGRWLSGEDRSGESAEAVARAAAGAAAWAAAGAAAGAARAARAASTPESASLAATAAVWAAARAASTPESVAAAAERRRQLDDLLAVITGGGSMVLEGEGR